MEKVVIIGGMAAGCKAASRLKRIMPESKITIIEKGSIISFGSCGMPFYASGDIPDFYDLAKTPYGILRDKEYFKNVKGVEVSTETEALKIDSEAKSVLCRNISGEEFVLFYDSLIIATGAKAKKAPFQIIKSDKITNFQKPIDAKNFRALAETGQVGSAVIIGGGFIGVELAEALVSLWGIETTLIEIEDRLLPRSLDSEISSFLEISLIDNGVNLMLSTKVESISLNDSNDPVVELSDNELITADHVFVCMGVEAEAEIAQKAGIKIGDYSGIITDNKLMTSIDGIYAGGDCIELKNLIDGKPSYFPLGSLANRQGRVIADNIAGNSTFFKGAVGNISLKVFDNITAATGFNESTAKMRGFNPVSVCGTWYDRPEYHPDHRTIFSNMVFDKNSKQLLGLQLFGKGEVTRYIDTFSVLLAGKKTIFDLHDLEHAYTPPHSGPISPLNFLGYIAVSHVEDGIHCLMPKSLNLNEFKGKIIDLREESEINDHDTNFESIKINISDLRNRLDDFDKNENIIFVCQKGPRSNEAARIFKNMGFKNISYLGGGLQMMDQLTDSVID